GPECASTHSGRLPVRPLEYPMYCTIHAVEQSTAMNAFAPPPPVVRLRRFAAARRDAMRRCAAVRAAG
ncbi:hypothetical protein, partial [Lysobacter antibioticus]|uniref:hypothetical protein n=1 Tax=Lysobacter antibioticus TaxID=84531 RepID=UPI001C97C579